LSELTRHDIKAADFLVLAQGGWVLDENDPVPLRAERLSGAALTRVLADLEAELGPLSVMVEALPEVNSPLWGDLDPVWKYPVLVEERSRADCLTGDVIKAFVRSVDYHVDDLLAAAARIVPPDVAWVTQAGLNFVEICPPNVNKGTGLAVVAEAVGVDPADVLVFGDMPNDLPMFAWAGWSRVAVANAHPSILAVADEVTLTNDEDGVAVYLDKLLSR
jgi:hydroxymethylpyrimidine pyrophosphatase-like HAD family hydrolase